MALINFYDTPLSEVSESKTVKGKKKVCTIIDDYLMTKPDVAQVFEVYNTETGETTYESVIPDSYKVVTIVNGEEKDLEYTVKSKDIVTIIFVPESNANSNDWVSIVGGFLLLFIGVVLTVASHGATTGTLALLGKFGVPLILGGAAALTTGIISAVTRQPNESSSSSSDNLSTEQQLTVQGAENPLIEDNNFPFVFGKIATNPYIVGSPYHETYVDKEGTFEEQYMSALFCLGYGPLKLTDIKVEQTILSYNRPRVTDGEQNNKTVMHGLVDSKIRATVFEQSVANKNGYYRYSQHKDGYDICDPQPTASNFSSGIYYKLNPEIPEKWKNNDIKFEILQRGLKKEDINIEEKHGQIYNKTIIEDNVNANILFVHDEDIGAAAKKHYKGVKIPQGYRTNSVRLSQSCPSHLEVEIDFQSGLFRTRSEKSGDKSEMKYYDLPVTYAVQWRPIRKDNPISDAENGSKGGWRTFDYLKKGKTKADWMAPVNYTEFDAVHELALNFGSSFANKNHEGLKRYAQDYKFATFYEESLSKTTADSVYSRPYGYSNYYNKSQQVSLAEKNATDVANKKVSEWADPKNISKIIEAAQAVDDRGNPYITSTYNKGWLGTKVFQINRWKNVDSKSYSPSSNFDVDEKIFVFTKDFTPEETKEILESDSDKVEVRVIRLTPAYIDEQGRSSNDTYGDFSYQDLGKWIFMRTTCFDKDKYKEACKNVEEGVSVNSADYPLRPIKEEDLEKFVFMSIRLKQDVAETGGASLKQVRCIAESFSPTYDKEKDTWYPENIERSVKYYQKQKIDGEWKIVALTEEEYNNKIEAGEVNVYKNVCGTNFVDKLADDIFVDPEDGKIQRFYLKDSVARKYINSNSCSSTMLALVGKHNGDDAKLYEEINMTAAAELFDFCEDVTDGSPQEYELESNYRTTCNLTDPRRKVLASAVSAKGWKVEEGSYCTYLPMTYWYLEDGTPSDDVCDFALNVTPILDDGTILTKAELVVDANKIAKGQRPNHNVFLSKLDAKTSEIYCKALNYIGDIYYDDVSNASIYAELKKLSSIPVNSFSSGINNNFLLDVCSYYGISEIYVPLLRKCLEQMSISQSTYKVLAAPDGLQHIKFSCNGVISEAEKLEDIIKKFLVTGRSIIKRDDENRYEFFIGRKQPYVMNVLNDKNVISQSNTRSFEDVPSGIQTVFPDEDDDYTNNPLYCMDKGEDWRNPSKAMSQLSIPYVTNRNQLWSLLCFNLAALVYQREAYTRTVGKFGLTVSIGDVLLIQGNSLLIGSDKGGRITEIIGEKETYTDDNGKTKQRFKKIYGFVSSEPYNYTGEIKQGKCIQGITIVQPEKYGASRCVTLRLATPSGNAMITADKMPSGLTNIVPLAYPIIVSEDGNYSQEESVNEDGVFVSLDPKIGNLLSFGEITKITEKAQVISIKPSNGKFQLSLIPYNDDFYNYGQAIPQFTPKMTTPKRDTESLSFTSYVTKKDVTDAQVMADTNKKDLSVDTTAQTTVKMCKATRDGIICTCETRDINNRILNPISVVWRFYREDVYSDGYKKADPQPTSETFTNYDYYIREVVNKSAGEPEYKYIKAETFEDNVEYYVENVIITDTLLFMDETVEQSYTHIFDRAKSVATCNGYPEYYDLYPIKVTATAKLTVASKTSESFFMRVGLDGYGTWIPNPPVVSSTIQDRSVILSFSQPPSQKTLYGFESLKYLVQIRRVEEGDSENFSRPDLNTIPYAEYDDKLLTNRHESSYRVYKEAHPAPISQSEITGGEYFVFVDSKTEDGKQVLVKDFEKATTYSPSDTYYVIDYGSEVSGTQFSQTLPLIGQGDSDSKPTLYQYSVKAVSINNLYSTPTTAQVQALVTNLRDIVRANLTAKSEYVENLAAISAKLGDISEGSLTGNDLNYWTLSTKEGAQESSWNKDFQGALRIGGEKQFLQVIPINIKNGIPQDYEIRFNVGAFEISTERTSLNSELIIYNPKISKVDRTRITTEGTFYEHRNNEDGVWYVVAKQETGGTLSKSVYSTESFLLSNSSVTKRRLSGYDIGKPYLSENSRVYHFDEDTNDQAGNCDYELILNPEHSQYYPTLKGKSDNNGINFTPAILAVAPYSEVGRSLYGVFGLKFNMNLINNCFTVDFWIKYYYAEGQLLFDIGTEQDRIQFICISGEPNYNVPLEGEPPYNYETCYSDMITYNHALYAKQEVYVRHQGVSTFEIKKIKLYNETFGEGEWKHIAVVMDKENIYCYIGSSKMVFARYSRDPTGATAIINDNNHSMIIDELFIDETLAESFSSFVKTSEDKIPWGALNSESNYMVLHANEDSNGKPLIKTNIFKSDEFKNAVKSIINSQE